MSVTNGQAVSAPVTNAAFVSRTQDSDTVGQLGLKKVTGSGAAIDNVQLAVNNLMDNIGQSGESDAGLEYTSNYFVDDDDALNVAVSKLDAQLNTTQTDLDFVEAQLGGLTGGGGGASIDWLSPEDSGAIVAQAAGMTTFDFTKGEEQRIVGAKELSATYTFGGITPKIKLPAFAAGTDNFKWQVTTTLIRPGTTSVFATTNQHVESSTDAAPASANVPVVRLVPLTDTDGKINSVLIQGDDILLIEVKRVAPSGTEETTDARLIKSLMEVSLS